MADDHKPLEHEYFNHRMIKKGAVIFVGITVVSLVVIFLYNDGLENLSVWRQLRWPFLLAALVAVIVDLYVGGLRNHIFVREFVPNISQRVCIDANLANIFMGAVTPSQSGGGPAQWYVLHRNGVKFADCIGTSFYGFIATLLFFPLTGLFALQILQDNIPDGFILHLTKFGFSVFTTLITVIMLGMFAPVVLQYVIRLLAGLIGIVHQGASSRVKNVGLNGIDKLIDYRKNYLGLIKKKPWLMIYCFLLTIVLYFNKYVLAYILISAFGIEVDFMSVITVMAVGYLLFYFAPSPGGSGIAEVSITALLAPFIGADLALTVTILHRSFMLFLPALIGSVIFLRILNLQH